MKPQNHSKAFTVTELLVVAGVFFVLTLLVIPALRPARAKPQRFNCYYNLRQVGLAFRLWSTDNSDTYPMEALALPAYGSIRPNSTNLFRYFQVMSNELSTPKELVCPLETKRIWATNFTTDFNNSHISYFVAMDANETNAAGLLTGDRNITNGTIAASGILNVLSNQMVGWTSELHNHNGNVAMADGSVQQLTNSLLPTVLTKTGLATNRLLMP